jgi:hypothetical protein
MGRKIFLPTNAERIFYEKRLMGQRYNGWLIRCISNVLFFNHHLVRAQARFLLHRESLYTGRELCHIENNTKF